MKNDSTIVLTWNDRKQMALLRCSLAGRKVIVMGSPSGYELEVLMESLLREGARMVAGVDDCGETHIAA